MGKRKGKKSDSEIDEIESLKRELQRVRSRGQWKEIADLLNRLGTLYRELKQFECALEYHEEEAEITKKYFPNDKIGLAIALRAKAEVYIEMKEAEEALPLVREYLKLSKNAADLVEEQRAHVTLGRVYLGLAIKYSESEDASLSESKVKALNKAENEFQRARDLANSSAMEDKRLGPGLMDMRCGVLLNIAIVLDVKGNLEGSKQFILKAIELARDNKFYEHVHRACTNLSVVYSKLGNFKDARAAADDAAKAGKSLDNFSMEVDARVLEAKMYFMLDEIGSGVRVLKKLRKQITAKRNDSVVEILEEVEPLLKAGVRITRKDDLLHTSDKMDYQKRQKLHECLGDGYVEIGNYTEAVMHYRKSIENAEKTNLSNKEVAKLYFSVAVTYKDNGDDANALKYFQKEIELHTDNPNEAFKTQTNITTSLEKIPHVSQEEIMSAHEKALELAKICDCPRKQVAALSNFGLYLSSVRRTTQAVDIRSRVDEIKRLYNLPEENEEPDSQDDLLDADGDSQSIDLDQLTTDEDSSEEDENETKIKTNPKKRKFRVNEKGETALHKSAIKGDIKMVRRLIRQGQDVNAKDMAGWVPLHEACNFGHLDIVEELLKNGANVNEPCGKVCGALTPLHDAANNGHSAVILILLNFKANVLVRDAKGNYPIDLLIAWRERAKADGTVFSPEDLATYREIRNVLKDLMEKGGRPYEKSEEIRARKNGKRDIEGLNSPQFELIEGRSREMGLIPVRITVEDYDPDDADAAVDLYSTTIRGLRRKPENHSRRRERNSDDETETTVKSVSTVRDGLIPASQYVDDDWLVYGGDLQTVKPGKHIKRKRERNALDDIRIDDSRNIRRRRGIQRNDVARLDIANEEENIEELLELDDIEIDRGNQIDIPGRSRPRSPAVEDNSNSISNSETGSETDFIPGPGGKELQKRSRTFSEIMIDSDDDDSRQPSTSKKSVNLIVLGSDEDEDSEEFGISDYHRLSNNNGAFSGSTSKSIVNKSLELSRPRCRVLQTQLPFKVVQNKSPNDSSNNMSNTSLISRPSQENLNRTESILRLKIRVNEKALVVPVVETDFNNTIEWLCEECSRRYFDNYGIKPILTLSTKDGAILSGNDIIRVVLYGNETELTATVISFDLQRLPDRFKTAAGKISQLKYDDEILVGLDVCQSSNILNLPDCNLRSKVGYTLFQALQYQNALRELRLPDCSLLDEGVKNLSSIISTLPNLSVLDLSCNGITSAGIHELSESFRKAPGNAQNQRQSCVLTTLDLSYNPLGNSVGAPLTNLLSQLTQLKSLLLVNCDFTLKLFTESRLNSCFGKLKLEEVDISYNEFGKAGLDRILRILTEATEIKSLNYVSCAEDEEDNFGTVVF